MDGLWALSARDIRALARSHAELFAYLFDNLPCRYDLTFDEAVAVSARLMVEYREVFLDIAEAGTMFSASAIAQLPWADVVSLACEVIEATRETWRAAWPNGFLQKMIAEELRPYSNKLRVGEA